ncbi:MAG: FHA domain-containing protein [Myxococcaceae bacterium]
MAKGSGEGQQFIVVQPETRIGRTPENDIVLAEVGVSREHARIFEKEGRYFLEDIGSANGTLLNGARIAGQRELSTGDSVAVGPVVLAFSVLGAEDVKAAVAAAQAAPRKPLRPALDPPKAPGVTERTVTEETQVVFDEPAPAQPKPPPPVAAPPLPAPRPPVPSAAPAPKGASGPISVPQGSLGVASQETRSVARSAVLMEPPRALVRAAEMDQQETRLKVPLFTPGDDEITNVPAVAPGPGLVQSPARHGLQAGPGEDEGTVSVVESASGADPRPLTAAERARRRRLAGETLGGQLSLFWTELSRTAKGVVLGLGLVLVGVTAAGFWVVFAPPDGPKLGAEGSRLGPEVVNQSFGLGDGVQFVRPDMKIFNFEFTVPTQAVAVLHYQASDISQDEVSIILNGVEQGMVPPDTSIADRAIEQVLSPKDLRRNATNQLTFDNLKNPPGKESWRVATLWIEVIPVPELPVPELHARAREFARRGKEFYDLRDVGSDNLFKSWKAYRQAWLTLVALPEPSRPELFLYVGEQRASLGRELDQKCRTLMLDARRNMQLKNPDKARETLEDVARYFPTTEHHCHNLALQTLNEYQL